MNSDGFTLPQQRVKKVLTDRMGKYYVWFAMRNAVSQSAKGESWVFASVMILYGTNWGFCEDPVGW